MSHRKVIQVEERPPWIQTIPLSFQHLFAMFSASVFVPWYFGVKPAVVLLMNGVGTLLFILITKGKAPAFLGSSFAFLAAAGSLLAGTMDENHVVTDQTLHASQYSLALGGFVVCGAIFCIVAVIIGIFGTKWINIVLPPPAMGAVVMLIGLGLSGSAVSSVVPASNPNWKTILVFCVTLGVAVLGSVLFRKFFSVIPILTAIVVGYGLAACLGMVNLTGISKEHVVALQNFSLPTFQFGAIVAILPAALVVINEHIGHQIVTGKVVGRDLIKDPGLHRSMFADGVSTMLSGFFGSVPTTTYGENIGVMAVTKVYSVWVIGGAAVISIILSFFGQVSYIIQNIPAPVMNGISLLLYGMIAASGIRLLVEAKVDYSRSRNLALTAVILVIGLSGVSIQLDAKGNTLSGMTLAAVVGIVLSLIFYLFDKLHMTNDSDEDAADEQAIDPA